MYGVNNIQKENDYNYYQKMNFIKFLSHEFQKFSEFILDPLQNNPVNTSSGNRPRVFNTTRNDQLSNARYNIIKYILDTALYFTKGPYDQLTSSQKASSFKYINLDEKIINARAKESLEKLDEKIIYDKILNVFFIFNNDLSTFTPITKRKEGQEFQGMSK